MAHQKLTKRTVDAVLPPVSGDLFIWDIDLKGFGLRVSAGGVKSYVLQYRMKGKAARRTTLGRHGSPWTPETARREAELRLLKIRQGVDPVEEERLRREEEDRRSVELDKRKREAEALAFDGYVDRFVDLYLKENWPATWPNAQRTLNNVKPAFAGKTITEITRSEVATLLDGYGDRPGARKIVHSLLRKLFNWAADRGDLDASPIASMKAPKAVAARRRVLSPEELVAVWHAAGQLGGLWRPLVRLLICTLQRREEVASLDWSELDMDARLWHLPAERAKNDHAHIVPLNELAIAELTALGPKSKGLVFSTTGTTSASGFSKVKRRLDDLVLANLRGRALQRGDDPDAVELPGWRFHDLRRTGATNLQALGVPVEVTEAILNHISGTTGGIAGVYNLYRYDREKVAALATWSKQLEFLTQAKELSGNVAPVVRYAA